MERVMSEGQAGEKTEERRGKEGQKHTGQDNKKGMLLAEILSHCTAFLNLGKLYIFSFMLVREVLECYVNLLYRFVALLQLLV